MLWMAGIEQCAEPVKPSFHSGATLTRICDGLLRSTQSLSLAFLRGGDGAKRAVVKVDGSEARRTTQRSQSW
jgi:hypothetical protein